MKNGRFVGLISAALLASVVLHTQTAQAAPYAARAYAYSVDFVRAMDECVNANAVTVVNPGGVKACPQANNSDTDSLVKGAIIAHLTVRRFATGPTVREFTAGPTLRLLGSGFLPPSQRVGVQLKIRTTNTASSPSGSKTYADETIVCGPNAGFACGHYFASTPNGRLAGSQTLLDCLTANDLPENLAFGNIEILDSALINCDDGKDIAKPGVRQ